MIYFCNMLNRIKEILLREGFASGSFADEIGVQRSSLSHILNARNNPSLDFILKTLQRFPNINSEWLLLGKGEMYNQEETEFKGNSSLTAIPDLFSSANKEPSNPEKVGDIDLDIESPVNEEINMIKAEKHVSQILIFYSDSTYQVYKPEKPE